MDNGFAFAEKNAMCTENSYSHTGTQGMCSASSCTVWLVQGSVTGYKDVTVNSVKVLMAALARNSTTEFLPSVMALTAARIIGRSRIPGERHGVRLASSGC